MDKSLKYICYKKKFIAYFKIHKYFPYDLYEIIISHLSDEKILFISQFNNYNKIKRVNKLVKEYVKLINDYHFDYTSKYFGIALLNLDDLEISLNNYIYFIINNGLSTRTKSHNIPLICYFIYKYVKKNRISRLRSI